MTRKRRPTAFERTGFGVRSGDEISVGAFARRQLYRRVAVGAFGGILLVAAFLLYGKLHASGSPRDVTQYAVQMRCADCGHETHTQVPLDQRFPSICPQCGARACRPIWLCRSCKHEFVPTTTAPVIQCPRCDSLEVGSALAGERRDAAGN